MFSHLVPTNRANLDGYRLTVAIHQIPVIHLEVGMKSPITRRHIFWLALPVLVASSLNARDAGATFDVQTANGQTRFHVGRSR